MNQQNPDDIKKTEDIILALGAVKDASGESLLKNANIELTQNDKDKIEAMNKQQEELINSTEEQMNAYRNMVDLDPITIKDEPQTKKVLEPGDDLDQSYLNDILNKLNKGK